MPANGSSGSQQQPMPDILKVAKLIQLPLTDAAGAERIITGVTGALKDPGAYIPAGKLNAKQAAQLSSQMAAALQCAGWLVAARNVNPSIDKNMCYRAVAQCLILCMWGVQGVPMEYDHLKAVLRTTADGKVPGGWLTTPAALRLLQPCKQQHWVHCNAQDNAALCTGPLACCLSLFSLSPSQAGRQTYQLAWHGLLWGLAQP
jgi:hypothetical protein